MFKKILLWLLVIIFSLTLLIGGAVWHNLESRPWTINFFFNRVVYELVKDSPETLTSLHFLEGFGIKGHQSQLDDASPESTDELFAKVKEYREMLLSYDDLSEDEQLSKDIMLYLMDYAIELEPYRYHNYPVNQLFGAQSNFPSFMDAQHQVHDARDAEDYIARLHAVKRKFSQIKEGLVIREENGIIPPRFVIDRVLAEMNEFVDKPIEENILYTSLQDKLAKTDLSSDEQTRLLEQAKLAIADSVHPAYQSFIDYFAALGDKATSDDGMWKLPQGEQAYRAALKLFTTTDYTPEEIHQTGLSEVERIQQEMLTILAEQGYDTEQGFTAVMSQLADEQRFYYADSDTGREQILSDYQTIIDEINKGLDEAFRVRPKATVAVKRIPEFKEKTSPGAYYQQPAIDGSRPGIFYANLYDIKATPKYGMRTLAYHEAVPGHHFQVTIQQELEGVPLFRKFAPFTAYTEGWALYAEQLAWELGFQNNPFDNIGRLQAELFRAVRLVVDTGIHAKKWTREEAIEYMLNNTGMAKSDVVSEIERYIVMPGQATSYKVGMIKILELREKAKTQLGDKFDLRDFHDVVLKNGAVPLAILERIVDRYIADTLAR